VSSRLGALRPVGGQMMSRHALLSETLLVSSALSPSRRCHMVGKVSALMRPFIGLGNPVHNKVGTFAGTACVA
jgi:hypothetical protein